LVEEIDKLNTSVKISRLITVAPIPKAVCNLAGFAEHCTVERLSVLFRYGRRTKYSSEARPRTGQAMKPSHTANAKTRVVNPTSTFQYLYINGTRSKRCLKKAKKANLTKKTVACWKRGTYAHTYEHTYAHTYTSTISYFRSGRSGLTLGVFIRPSTSFFICMLYQTCSTY